MSINFEDELNQFVRIGPKESFHVIANTATSLNPNYIVTRRIDLGNSHDRHWLIEKVRANKWLPFGPSELRSILDLIAGILSEEWLTIYKGSLLALKTGERTFYGFYLFNHLVPLGRGLSLLKGRQGFSGLIHKLNQISYERLSSLLEAFAASRYAASGYRVELEPKIMEGKTPDFRVKLGEEWIYFECKRINIGENLSIRKNMQFVSELEQELIKELKDLVPKDCRVEVRIDKKPSKVHKTQFLKDIKQMIVNGNFNAWAQEEWGKYAILPKFGVKRPIEYPMGSMQITVGTMPTPLSVTRSSVAVYFNPFGSKIEQKFRSMLRKSKDQIPQDSRGILIIQGLDEEKGMKILQERIGHDDYHNIIAGVALGNGAIAVRRNDHNDVNLGFIGTSVSNSLFHGYDVGSH